MQYKNVLNIKNRKEFRDWLKLNSTIQQECYLELKKGKPSNDKYFYYLDALEEALCFGWIDSTVCMINGKSRQRFSKRRNNSNWTELNKERVRRLMKLGLMEKEGLQVLPKMGPRSFKIDSEIKSELVKARVWSKFKKLPLLYQRVRASNLYFYKQRDELAYKKMLEHTIKETKLNKTFGEWNDYGRLLKY